MTSVGQFCLLAAFVSSGYAAFACLAGSQSGHRAVRRSGLSAAIASVLALTAVAGLLGWALLVKDFRFAYVAQYSSRDLPWHYSLSAFWVGQAGSLLLWAWFLGLLALAYRFWPARQPSPLREPAFGVAMAYLCFLMAVMVFDADPMQPSLSTLTEGAGLNPLLQHPAMLIHPPIVFLGYAGWTIPFALAVTALVTGRTDASWTREARLWVLLSWGVLGAGILVGADWAYEELGWGGYWGWDPVENGSLIPWLTGTACIHCLMAWRYRAGLKKLTLSLAIATFVLCNFAAFLTRSGIFSSLHAFSRSPTGWMFLALVAVLTVGGGFLVVLHRRRLAPERPIFSLWSCEVFVLISTVALLLLSGAVLGGTLTVPVSDLVLGQKIVVGTSFYNHALIPTGLLLLATTAAVPLLRWETPPSPEQKKMLLLATGVGGLAAMLAFVLGVWHPIALAVTWLAVAAALAVVGALILDVRRADPDNTRLGLLQTLSNNRRQYGGYLIHLGFVCLAIGVTGSSLGTRRREALMNQGETIHWAGRSIHFRRLRERELPDKLVVEAELDVSRDGARPVTLRPAQHLHLRENNWTTEVAIHSTWGGDFYTILHGGEGESEVSLTFVVNPMMRWIWFGGWVMGAGVLAGTTPARRRFRGQSEPAGVHAEERPKQRRMAAAALWLALPVVSALIPGHQPTTLNSRLLSATSPPQQAP